MKECTLHVDDGVAATRLVRALGSHRYVASRLHNVHAFVFASIDGIAELDEACGWAKRLVGSGVIDISTRDERLWRTSTEAEIAAALGVFWGTGLARENAHKKLRNWLEQIGAPPVLREPFSPEDEEAIFPLLIDAGWELLPLAQFDAERHKGVIAAYGEPIYFEAARFEEESRVPPPIYQFELPALGPHELLHATDASGAFVDPRFPLWVDAPTIYASYLLRGVARAAKISEPYFSDDDDDDEDDDEDDTPAAVTL